MAVKTVIEAVREAMLEEMRRDERVFVMGEDVGQRGGVFEQPPAVGIGGNQQHHAALGDTVFAAQPHLVQLKGVADCKDQRCPMFKGFANSNSNGMSVDCKKNLKIIRKIMENLIKIINLKWIFNLF